MLQPRGGCIWKWRRIKVTYFAEYLCLHATSFKAGCGCRCSISSDCRRWRGVAADAVKMWRVVDATSWLEEKLNGCGRRGGSGDAAAARQGWCSSDDVDEALGSRLASLRVLSTRSLARWDRGRSSLQLQDVVLKWSRKRIDAEGVEAVGCWRGSWRASWRCDGVVATYSSCCWSQWRRDGARGVYMRDWRQGRHSINKIKTAVLVCLLVEVWVKTVTGNNHNLVSGSPNWWMRCVGTGTLL